MLSDHHLHTFVSGDSPALPRDQIEAAIARGMTCICLTDHMDFGQISETGRSFTFDTPSYTSYVRRLAEEYKDRIDLRVGMELGLDVTYADEVEAAAASAPFDYIIGSIHVIDAMDPYYPGYFPKYGDGPEGGYRRYFETALEAVRRFDCFDCFGHLDYILRYGRVIPEGYPATWMDQIEPILKTLIEKGKGIEFNTAGLRRNLPFANPHPDIVRRYLELGGEILCVGSDAHTPPHVGWAMEEARETLLACGAKYYTTFRDRKPEFHKL